MPNRKNPTKYSETKAKSTVNKNPFSAAELQKKLTQRSKMLKGIK